MPYHVRITRKSNRSHDEVKLDLTKEQLMERFVNPYYQGRAFIVGGMTIPSDDVERIRITLTDQTSNELIPLVRMERAASNVVVDISDEWYVAERGADVTDQFITAPPGSGRNANQPEKVRDGRSVFVVHGRNLKARDALFEFLRSIGLHPIEWSEAIVASGKPSPYVGEVLDAAFSQAQAVVVLMTPDDEARLREPFRKADDPQYEIELTPQARPNVLFEAGMAMGRDPNRTVLVALGSLREFSDIGGRHVLKMDNSTKRRQELAQRLESAGCPINLKGTDWHNAGEFAAESELAAAQATPPQKEKTEKTKAGSYVFGCDHCGSRIVVYPPDTHHRILQTEPCKEGDSIKIEPSCFNCDTKNIRYWDVYHFHVAVG